MDDIVDIQRLLEDLADIHFPVQAIECLLVVQRNHGENHGNCAVVLTHFFDELRGSAVR